MPKDQRTRRRTTLNRDRVLDVAVTLADAQGIDALTMRGLGRALGVEAMSLYNHVGSKDDLLDGMVDRVAAEIDTAHDGPDWRHRARRRAISAHTALTRHPWAPPLWASRITLGPARMSYMDSALRTLREAGFAPHLLDSAYHTIENHVLGHALQSIGFPVAPEDMERVGAEFLSAFPADDYPDLAAHIRHHVDHPGQDDDFTFGLDLILNGLETLRRSAD